MPVSTTMLLHNMSIHKYVHKNSNEIISQLRYQDMRSTDTPNRAYLRDVPMERLHPCTWSNSYRLTIYTRPLEQLRIVSLNRWRTRQEDIVCVLYGGRRYHVSLPRTLIPLVLPLLLDSQYLRSTHLTPINHLTSIVPLPLRVTLTRTDILARARYVARSRCPHLECTAMLDIPLACGCI